MTARTTARLALVALVLLAASLACDWGGGGDDDYSGIPGYYVTATYGAKMLHAQFTAIAETPQP